MKISEEQIAEIISIYRSHYRKEISREEAVDILRRLDQLYHGLKAQVPFEEPSERGRPAADEDSRS